MNTDAIGKRIRAARKRAHLRQLDLAEMTGHSANYISILERGKKTPSFETFIEICNALHVSADEVLCDVLEEQHTTRSSRLIDQFSALPQKKQEELYRVIEVMIRY